MNVVLKATLLVLFIICAFLPGLANPTNSNTTQGSQPKDLSIGTSEDKPKYTANIRMANAANEENSATSFAIFLLVATGIVLRFAIRSDRRQ